VSANLFLALRHAFPPELDSTAIETADGVPLLYTWRDLDESSARMANFLDSLALPRGTRIAVQTDKSVDALILYLAVLRSGNVFLPLNTAYQTTELEYFLKDAEPAVLVCGGRSLEGISRIARAAGVTHVLSLNDDRTGTLLERAATMSPCHVPAVVAGHELAVILYTSGTTGRSKGAMLSHGNLLSNALTLKNYWGWQRGDVLIHALPIFHTHGLFVAAQGALLSGCRTIWFGRFDPKAVIARLPEASVFMGVPTLYVRMLQEPSLTPAVCRQMRLFVAGSAPLLPETFHQWRDRTHHTILERYGMSETVMLTSNPYFPADGERRAGTVGFPLPSVRLRIAGESGATIAPNEIGGIEVAGPSVFAGYWRAPDLTREAFTADGWFRTGDVGKIDERGYVTIVGRSKDLIITGGYNVYPAEVESYLNELPGITESAVIGVPHPDFGEAVIAVVVARGGARPEAAMLISELKRKIATFKVPKQVFVVDELPRNVMGKVQKALLRERHKGLF
jgi:malonyl-CoA/methylmalonyl-CoA synthetase